VLKVKEVDDNRTITVILLVGLLVGILICLIRIAFGAPSPSESLLLSALLTFFSILGSWIVSKHYSEHDFNKSLRLFALKAAEKVTNLSKELDRLSVVLQEEIKDEDYDSPQEAVLAKTIRMEGAIHIVRTLKSVNDGSLSDWQGVIGEEITAKLEDQEQREETLRELFERFESLQSKQPELPETIQEDEQTAKLRAEVDSIRDDLRMLVGQVSGLPVRSYRVKSSKLPIQKNCPVCSEMLSYRQKQRPTSVRPVKCTNCGASLYSRQVDGEYVLKQRAPLTEEVECPVCNNKIQVNLDPVPGAIQDSECSSCKTPMRAIRRENGVKLKVKEAQAAPSKIVEERIREAMGPQPWQPGRARTVADQLGLPLPTVSRTIKSLIEQGTFKVQIDGKLYSPDAASPDQK
jgi:hypothetical protein